MTAQVRYRAWCLSWDEGEEHGADVVGYDVAGHDFAREDRGVVYAPIFSLGTPAEAAEAYADYVHSQRDGWDATWPLRFRVRSPDGSTADFEVNREYVAEFSASPIGKPRSTKKSRKANSESAA